MLNYVSIVATLLLGFGLGWFISAKVQQKRAQAAFAEERIQFEQDKAALLEETKQLKQDLADASYKLLTTEKDYRSARDQLDRLK